MTNKQKRTKEGLVTACKSTKTAIVSVSRVTMDRMFKKYLKKVRTYKVHDEKNECRVGDRVEIVETRPISKDKSWKLQKVLVRSEGAEA